MSSPTSALVTSLPTGWSRAQLRRVTSITNGGTPSSDARFWEGEIPFITPPDLRRYLGSEIQETERLVTEEGARAGSALVDEGVIISNRAPIGYVSRVAKRSAFNQGCKVFGAEDIDQAFLMYALMAATPALQALGQGTTFMEISSMSLAGLQLPVPSRAEQTTIADFLGRETAKLDALIEQQNAMIDLLRERRSAVAESVILPEVRAAKLGYFIDVLPGYAFSSEKFSTGDEDVRLLRGINVKPEGLDWTEEVRWPKSEGGSVTRYQLEAGDIVLGLDRPFVAGGTRVARVEAVDLPCLLLQRVLRLRPKHGLTRDFLYLLLASRAFREYAEPEFTGVSVPHLSDAQVRAFRVGIPSEKVQRDLSNAALLEISKIDTLIAKAEQFVELARERRAALITAAVTGQIDVTGKAS